MAIPSETSRFQAIKKIADKLALSEDALWKDLQEHAKQNKDKEKSFSGPAAPKVRRVERLESIEKKIIGILYSKKYFNGDDQKKKELEKIKIFGELSADDISELTLEAEITYGDVDIGREWKILLLHLEEEHLKKRLETMMMELQKTEKGKGETKTLVGEIQILTKRIQAIKNQTEKI